MLFHILLLSLLFYITECRHSHSFTVHSRGRKWKNEIKSCGNWGELNRNLKFTLPSLKVIGLYFCDINEFTTVIARFDEFVAYANVVPKLNVEYLVLSHYSVHNMGQNQVKEYTGYYGYESRCGASKQATAVRLALQLFSDGDVTFNLFVLATAWNSTSCTETKVHVDSLQIFT
ncbi:hypothetical protein NE865_03108 [Phthorimaea operculella]|nr:hypothetical protein NE865_03108 [Phthorimaea operculella]